MKESLAEHRMVQNEMVFKKANSRIQQGFDELDAMAREDGVPSIKMDSDMEFTFICECSDETCRKRISLTMREYKNTHVSSKYFILYPDHNVPKIEDIIFKGPNYIVVKKHVTPPGSANKLHKTDINN